MGITHKSFDFPVCANCSHRFWYGEIIYLNKDGYRICKQCSEREHMPNIKITAEIDGKIVPLNTISTESFEAIKALEKPKEIPVPVARVGDLEDSPMNGKRLFLKLTDSIRENVAKNYIDVIAVNLQTGSVNNTWQNEHEASNLDLYENIQPL